MRDALFGGCNHVVDIPALQAWLECAWEAGFDPCGPDPLHVPLPVEGRIDTNVRHPRRRTRLRLLEPSVIQVSLCVPNRVSASTALMADNNEQRLRRRVFRVGRKQLGGRVQGTRKWVGTTEAAALLRSFGLRARIVDFLGSRNRTASGRPPPAGRFRCYACIC